MKKMYTTSAKLPKSIQLKMNAKIIQDGHGFRSKSKWISEAIGMFLKLENYPELTDIAEDMEEMNDLVSLRVTEELMNQLEKAVISVRKQYPAMEGVKSKIIRSSIIQRLIRG